MNGPRSRGSPRRWCWQEAGDTIVVYPRNRFEYVAELENNPEQYVVTGIGGGKRAAAGTLLKALSGEGIVVTNVEFLNEDPRPEKSE